MLVSIFTTLITKIRELPLRTTPLDTDMIPCDAEAGGSFRTTRGAIRAELTAPGAHAASHISGSDQVATTTPAVSSIPKTPVDSTKLDPWISAASTSTPGLAQLAVNGQTSAGVVVQGDDTRLLRSVLILPTEGPEAVAHKLQVNNAQGLELLYIENLPLSNIGYINIDSAAEDGPGVVTLAPDGDDTPGLVVQADDSRLSDARTPTAHVHAAADITSGVIAIARLATGTPDGTKFIRDDGTLAVPSNTPSVQHIQRINATQNKTANFTLTDADSFSLFTNLGATGEVQAQLQASPASGSMFFFFVATAQSFTILPGSGHSIKIGPGSSTISIVGSVIGCFCVLVYTGGGVWSGVTSGTWIFSSGD